MSFEKSLFSEKDGNTGGAGSKDPASRIKELSGLLRRWEYEYYILSKPSVSDLEYDRHYDELIRLEKDHPELVLPDSPSRRVGSDLSHELPEVSHSIPVLSLDKAYDSGEIAAWMRRCARGLEGPFGVIVEEKMDGASLVLYYRDGRLERAVTRGNGEVGNDVTPNVRTIRTIPMVLNRPLSGAIRGEIYMTISDFNRVKSQSGSDYANPRNFASGSLRRIKSSEVARIPLRFYAYEPYGSDFSDSHHGNLALLEELGFSVNPHRLQVHLDPRNEDELEKALGEIRSHIDASTARRAGLDYEIDGLVLKIDELPLREQLGYTGHHPRWAIAYKFESPEGQTMVRDIEIQVGRSGRITPVARVEPVHVGGTTIQNVTLHNQDYIDALGLAPGDRVAVSRRGDVIPAVERVLEKGESAHPVWTLPAHCPACSSVLERKGAHHFCPNYDCPERKLGRLVFFTGRDQMDIENLGGETVETLLREGLISDIPDLFRLDYERLEGLPGFGEKKVALIREGIEKARGQSYRRIMVSLGLPDFGPKLAELLEGAGYRSIDSLFDLLDRGELSLLAQIKGVGEKTVESLAVSLAEPRFRSMVEELRFLGLSFTAPEPDSGLADLPQIFAGQIWCVTGSFERWNPRSLAMEEVKKRGGEVVSGVSSRTTHLLAGSSAGSKLDKARQLGVEVVDETAFNLLLGSD